MNMMIQIVAFWLLWLAPLSAQGRADSPFWNARGVGSRLISQPMHTSKTSVTNRGDDGFNKLRDSRISAKAALSSRLRDIEMDVKFTEATGISVLGERGGVDADQITNVLDQTVSVTFKIVATACQTILPPVVALTKVIVGFYSILPVDATLAQAGLVYCFAGGYFPTLFAAVQAAQQCGLEVMIGAVGDLADEAVAAIRACNFQPNPGFFSSEETKAKAHEIFTEKTKIILATIDPMKINQAVAALYTTWMGVSTVLEREFAKTITMSVTIADYLKPTINFVLGPPVYRCVPKQYHKWVPIIIGWACKAAAMSVAWRVQRVLTAYTSAIAGGLMFSRSCIRMLRKRGVRLFGLIPDDCDHCFLDEIVGFTVAGFGLYSQIGGGFDFEIPFPINLVTWPFSLAERWIQWQITKKKE